MTPLTSMTPQMLSQVLSQVSSSAANPLVQLGVHGAVNSAMNDIVGADTLGNAGTRYDQGIDGAALHDAGAQELKAYTHWVRDRFDALPPDLQKQVLSQLQEGSLDTILQKASIDLQSLINGQSHG